MGRVPTAEDLANWSPYGGDARTEPHLPGDITAERDIATSILLNEEHAAVSAKLLEGKYFLDRQLGAIVNEANRQHRDGGIDPQLVARNLKGHPAFPDGAEGLIYDLLNGYATRHHFPRKCSSLIENYRKRKQSLELANLAKRACNGVASSDINREVAAVLDGWRREFQSFGNGGRFKLAELRADYPMLRTPVIDGICRRGETVNIVSHAKAGKSWFGYGLAFSIITGEPFLDRFATTHGRVLLIDNELHRETLAYRLGEVAAARGLRPEEYADDFEVWPLRGQLRSLADLAVELESVKPGDFSAIIWDSKYRFGNSHGDENSNAAETEVYNLVDEIGERTGACQFLILHTSKGNQSDKRVTDVGSGAGSQSRAADTHLVLREHEEEGLAVLDAAVRSFAPIEPMVLRWEFPRWIPDEYADPARLKRQQTRGEQRQTDADREGVDLIIKALGAGPATARQLREKTGLGKDRQQRLLDWMVANDHATTKEITIRGNICREYTLQESDQ